MPDLDDILGSEELKYEDNKESSEKPETEKNNATTKQAEVRDDTDKVEKTEADPVAKEEEKTVPLAALKDERQKRQELEKKRQELERQLSYAQGKAESQQPKEEEPKVDNDKLVDELLENPHAVLQRERELAKQEMMDEIWLRDAKRDSAKMSKKHSDYEAKAAQFMEMAKMDPTLEAAIRQTDTPAQYVYDYMNLLEMKTNPEKLKAKLRKEIEEEIKAGKTEKVESKPSSSTPTTQGATRGVAPGAGEAYERASLTDIFGSDHFDK